MGERPRDEYSRPIYADNEIPPIGGGELAVWRGRVVESDPPDAGNTTTMHRDYRTGRDTCVQGWVASGEWWLHCGYCRPYESPTEGEAT